MIEFIPGKEYEVRNQSAHGNWEKKKFLCFLNTNNEHPPRLAFLGVSRQGREFVEEHPYTVAYMGANIRTCKKPIKFHVFLVQHKSLAPASESFMALNYRADQYTEEDARSRLLKNKFSILGHQEIEYTIDEESN